MYKKTVLLFSIVILSQLLLLRGPSYAAQKGALELSPAFLDVVLKTPNEEKKITLDFANQSDKPISLEIFPIDFKQKDEFGTLSFLGQEAGSFSYSLSSFLSFESNRLDLDAHEKKKFSLSVKNRQDLSPGGHYAAVIARLVTPVKSKEGHEIIAPSISSLILLRKEGGERFNLSLTNVDWPTRSVEFTYPNALNLMFQNEGNVHVIPYGTAEVRDPFNRVLYKGYVNTSSLRILPESRRRIVVDLVQVQSGLPLSLNTMRIHGEDSLGKTAYNSTTSFIYLNPYFLFILLLGCGYFLQRRLRRKKK